MPIESGDPDETSGAAAARQRDTVPAPDDRTRDDASPDDASPDDASPDDASPDDAAPGGAHRRPAWRRPWVARLARAVAVVAIGLGGGAVGALLAPETTTTVGPLTVRLQVVPDVGGGMQVLLPPAGQVEFDTHAAPLAVQARVEEVDLESARRVIDTPGAFMTLSGQAPEELRSAAVHAALTTLVCAVLGAVVAALLAFRLRWRMVTAAVASLASFCLAVVGVAAITFDADSFAQPRFTGLLSQAPYLTRSSAGLAQRLESYRSGLSDIVSGVTGLYATTGDLPVVTGAGSDDVVTLLHVSDIHLNPLGFDLVDRLVRQFGVDLVVDTGDITTWGTGAESSTLARIGGIDVPYVFVRGNHDSVVTEAAIRRYRNAVVLDDEVATVAGVTIAGIGDPEFTPDAATQDEQEGEDAARESADLQLAAGRRLTATVQRWNEEHPEDPVDVAAIHDPAGALPLYGYVPTVLAGHTHSRSVTIDPTGTVQLVEGSTGGAGITARGLQRLNDGEPLPLQATVVYVARGGERAGKVIGYDEVSVGGYGSASATLQRKVLRADEVPALRPPVEETATMTPSTPR